ncbi:MAG: hypothetical protein KAU17_12060 [Spirochaetales bacterium]|nr:hypothetical protein [Spirochaetales bacterium]
MGVPDPNDNPEVIRKDFPPSDCRAQERFVAFCDVLGFLKLVEQLDVSRLAEKYDTMLREARASCIMVKTYPSPKPWIATRYRAGSVIFSDTMLLWSNPDNDDRSSSHHDTDSFFHYVAGVFSIGLKMGFPFRMGIAYGKCVINPAAGLFLGQPMIHAYETEQAQDWVGIACHPSCFNSPGGDYLCMAGLLDGWQFGPLIEYDIPVKREFKDRVSLRHSIDWPFWGRSDWGGFVDLEGLLRDKVEEYEGTTYGHRWQNALKYLEFRLSIWKSIERDFSNRRPRHHNDSLPNNSMDSDGE